MVPGTLCQTRPSLLTHAPPVSIVSGSIWIVLVVTRGGIHKLSSICSPCLAGYTRKLSVPPHSAGSHVRRGSYQTDRRQIFRLSSLEATSKLITLIMRYCTLTLVPRSSRYAVPPVGGTCGSMFDRSLYRSCCSNVLFRIRWGIWVACLPGFAGAGGGGTWACRQAASSPGSSSSPAASEPAARSSTIRQALTPCSHECSRSMPHVPCHDPPSLQQLPVPSVCKPHLTHSAEEALGGSELAAVEPSDSATVVFLGV